jgi:hypothetical protein
MTFSKWPEETDVVVQHKHTPGKLGLQLFLSETSQNKCSDSSVFTNDAWGSLTEQQLQQSDPPAHALILL